MNQDEVLNHFRETDALLEGVGFAEVAQDFFLIHGGSYLLVCNDGLSCGPGQRN